MGSVAGAVLGKRARASLTAFGDNRDQTGFTDSLNTDALGADIKKSFFWCLTVRSALAPRIRRASGMGESVNPVQSLYPRMR